MPYATVNGIDLHYREAGEGYPIVLVHGFTGNSRNWVLTAPQLARSFRTVSVDLRGHGHSAKPTAPEDYAVDVMAEDVHALIRELGIDSCYLAGHSMGGMIAQRLILGHPQLFSALVLVDTAAEMPNGMRTEERARFLQIAREQGMEAVFEEQLRINPQADRLRAQPQLLEIWRQQFLLTSLEAYLYCARAMAERRPLLERLNAIEAPTLIVCGENDEPFRRPSQHMHERIGGSELTIIPGAGHTPQIEAAGEFNRVLSSFLSRVHQTAAAGG